MRTNVVIDEELMAAARVATGLKTKRAVIEEALRRVVQCKEQVRALKSLKGLGGWEGDLKQMRKGRSLPKW
jgi:Arc/MetJ family transcription regulator